jgi:hypothetical protein
MTEFVNARMVQEILDPTTGKRTQLIDFQYYLDRKPKPIPSPKNYTSISRTLEQVGFDAPLASTIAREFVELP